MAEISSGVCRKKAMERESQYIESGKAAKQIPETPTTYKLLEFIPVLDLDNRLSVTADDLERPADNHVHQDASRSISDLIPQNHPSSTRLDQANAPVLDILLDIRVDKVPTDQSLGVENGVLGVRGSLVLGGVSNQSFVGSKSDP